MPQGETWNFTQKIRYLIECGLIDEKDVKYTNQTLINGYLFNKPREKDIDGNKTIMTFSILQVHPDGKYSFYPCRTYAKKVQEQIRNIENISFVNVEGQLMYRESTTYVLQVISLEISHEFVDMPLQPMYERKDYNGKQEN